MKSDFQVKRLADLGEDELFTDFLFKITKLNQ